MTGTACLHCHITFGERNSKGRIVKKQANGLCATCYSRVWTNKEGRTCLKCNKLIISSAKLLCAVCHEKQRDEKFLDNPKKKKPESIRKLKQALNNKLDSETFELIRRLLARFNSGLWLHHDTLRVVDVYMSIYDYEARLDAYGSKEQLEIMLRRLKELWLFNKHRIETTDNRPPKKRGRPFKV